MTAATVPVPSRWTWQHLDADQAADLWAELVEWVEWVRERYELPAKQVPPCWFQHPRIVEILTYTMAGWKAVYYVYEQEAWGWYRQDVAGFMEHEFWPAIRRVGEAFSGCSTGRGCQRIPVQVETLHTLGEVIAADVDARRQPPESGR